MLRKLIKEKTVWVQIAIQAANKRKAFEVNICQCIKMISFTAHAEKSLKHTEQTPNKGTIGAETMRLSWRIAALSQAASESLSPQNRYML